MSLIILFSLPTCLVYAQFGEARLLTDLGGNGNFFVADFDNDGDQDILDRSNHYYPDKNRIPYWQWFENQDGAGGDWLQHQLYINEGDNDEPVVVGDFDNDGWTDFISGASSSNTAIFHRNEGGSGMLSFTQHPLTLTYSDGELEAGDIDGDGDLDLIAHDGTTITKFTNEGGATFTEAPYLGSEIPFHTRLVDAELVDLDADGDLDIVASAYESRQEGRYASIFWYENEDGNGEYKWQEKILWGDKCENPADCEENGKIELADFNGDQLPDVLFRSNGDDLYLYFQANNQSFGARYDLGQTFDWDPYFQIFLRVGDMDRDGDQDIFRMGLYDRKLSWLRNINGTGDFEEVIIEQPTVLEFTDDYGLLTDLEGDGDLDVLFRGDNLLVYRNEGIADTLSGPFYLPDRELYGSFEVIESDIDEDGDQDLVYLAKVEGDLYWQERVSEEGDFASPQLLLIGQDNLYAFKISDLDGDGDEDILTAHQEGSNIVLLIHEKNGSTPSYKSPIQFYASFAAGTIYENDIAIVDWDNDGEPDIIFDDATSIRWVKNKGGLNFSVGGTIITGSLIDVGNFDRNEFIDLCYSDSEIPPTLLIRASINEVKDVPLGSDVITNEEEVQVADIDEDGDDDVIFHKRDPFSLGEGQLLLYYNNGARFLEQEIATTGFLQSNFSITDLDGDGKKDILFSNEWLRQLETPFDFNEIEFSSSSGYDLLPILLTDMDGKGAIDPIFNHFSSNGLYWRPNFLQNRHLSEGAVFLDRDENCQYTNADSSLYGWIVAYTKDDQTYTVSTSPQGNYSAFLPDTGNYIVNVLTPSTYWQSCVEDSLLKVEDISISSEIDFPVQIEQECPLLGLTSSGTRLRPCIPGYLTFGYCNYGTVPADEAQLIIQPGEGMLIDSSSLAWTSTTDSSYTFDLGDVAVGACGKLVIYVTPDCQSLAVGDEVCVQADIFPNEVCLPLENEWDGSTIEASGFCATDSVIFRLENIGDGAMSADRQFKIEYIVNDDIVMLFADTFNLGVGEIKEITAPAGTQAIWIEAEQDENHPISSAARATVVGCGFAPGDSILSNLIHRFPDEDGNPFSETYCRILTGSYDPNEKQAFPLGDASHQIDRDWELEYVIHFQNTGNDTAFTVIVRDLISRYLDLSTLRIGVASHDFVWQLNTDRELSFTFDQILLPDSSTNLLQSQGYVQFFIAPRSDVPVQTAIDNQALIYFDANAPITTANVRRIIRKPVTAESQHQLLCSGELFDGLAIFSDTVVVDTLYDSLDGCHLLFNHLDIPPSVFYKDTVVTSGTLVYGWPATQDTLLQIIGTDVDGCETTTFLQVLLDMNTAVEHNIHSGTIQLYPNPATDRIEIYGQLSLGKAVTYEIINAKGQQVKTGPLAQPFLDVSRLKSGLYILRIKMNGKVGIGKFVLL